MRLPAAALGACLACALAACALPAARQHASDYCEHHGGRALILEQHDNGAATVLVDEGEVRYQCVPPAQVLTLRPDFGAEVATDPEVAGAIIVSVKGAGIAAHAGLQAGDVITELAGTPIGSAQELQAAVAGAAHNQKVLVGILHRGKPQQLGVQF
jgi:membrane-associated protease RseP (regulator of RpoE activity)